MFDIRAIRDNPDAFRSAFERKQKGLSEVVSHMLDHDAAVRKAVSDKQEAESARNAKSKMIGKAKASGDEALFEQLRAEVAAAKDVIEAAGEQEAAARAELDKLLLGTPNIRCRMCRKAKMKPAMSNNINGANRTRILEVAIMFRTMPISVLA